METNGKLKKQMGLDLVSVGSEDFLGIMREAAIKTSKDMGWVTVDILRRYADNLGIEPHHPNAWGAVSEVRSGSG